MSNPFTNSGIDLGGIDEKPLRDLIPAGTYTCKIANVVEGYGKESKELYWRLDVEVIEGPHAGAKMFDYASLSWSEKSRGKAKTRLLMWLPGIVQPNARISLEEIAPHLQRLVMRARVTVQTDPQYGDKNSISELSLQLPGEDGLPEPVGKPGKAKGLLG
jgi:hypothetical protein